MSPPDMFPRRLGAESGAQPRLVDPPVVVLARRRRASPGSAPSTAARASGRRRWTLLPAHPQLAATRAMTARASSHRWQPGLPIRVMRSGGHPGCRVRRHDRHCMPRGWAVGCGHDRARPRRQGRRRCADRPRRATRLGAGIDAHRRVLRRRQHRACAAPASSLLAKGCGGATSSPGATLRRWRGSRSGSPLIGENLAHVAKIREQALAFVAGHPSPRSSAIGEEVYDEVMADKIWPGTRALAQGHLEPARTCGW